MNATTALRYVDALALEGYISPTMRRRAQRRITTLAAQRKAARRRRARTYSAAIVRRLSVPATCAELAALFRRGLNNMNAMLRQLEEQGRVRRVPGRWIRSAGGRLQILWERVPST